MKKAAYFFLALFLLAGCRKTLLDSYEKKFYGTWENTAIQPLDGGDKNGLAFRGGTFELQENGFFRYTDTYRNVYEGTWKLYEDYDENCHSDGNGNTVCDKTWYRHLQLKATHTLTREEKSATFDTPHFIVPQRFTCRTAANNFVYEYRFDQ